MNSSEWFQEAALSLNKQEITRVSVIFVGWREKIA